MSFLHLALSVFLFIYTAEGQFGGHLYFELIQYENRQDVLADGSSCEIFGGSCDPYFKICISLEKSISGCELLSYRTAIFENRRSITSKSDGKKLGNPLRERVLSPVPQTVRVTIVTLEYDNFGPHQDSLISMHEGLVNINPIPNGRISSRSPPEITLKRKDRAYNRVDIRVKVYAVCDKNVFGKFCERHCAPSSTYNCDEEGNKICLPGWRGDDCMVKDECRFEPCAPGAECIYETASSKSHVCTCNGGSGPECYPGYDFCKDNSCQNGAICVSQNSSCLCYGPFYGSRCEHMINLCQSTPCENNGTCVMSPSGVRFCLCQPGFLGDYCEILEEHTHSSEPMNAPIIDVDTNNSEVASAGMSSREWIWPTLAVIIFLLVIAFVLLAIFGRRRLIRAKRSLSRPAVVHLGDQDAFNIYEMPILSDPSSWTANGRESSSDMYSQALSPHNSEYLSMNLVNEGIYEEHLYEDCEKLGQPLTTDQEAVYAIPDNVSCSRHEDISKEQTQNLLEDVYVNTDETDETGYEVPPPLPLRNLP